MKQSPPYNDSTIETPIKENNKCVKLSHVKTAESFNLPHSANEMSVADIDAEDLFDNFNCIITITEADEEQEQQ
jgi:hypothetical protein